MLKFECFECDNSTALIYKDNEGDIVTECLACEDIQLVTENKDLRIQ